MTVTATDIYGPIFIGVMTNIALYGITITQVYLYFNVYKRDQFWKKALVTLLFVLDTTNTALDIYLIYDPIVNNFGNYAVLSMTTTMWASDLISMAAITLITHLFFAWRVQVLSGSWLMVPVIVLGGLAACGGTIANAIWVTHVRAFADYHQFKSVVVVWLGASAAVNIVITATLLWYLAKDKRGLAATDDAVDKCLRLTMQTGLLVTVFVVIELAIYLVLSPPSTVYLMFNLCLSKLYINTLMSNFNSRRGWKYDDHDGSTTLAASRNVTVNVSHAERSKHDTQQIFVNVESHEMVDVGDVKSGHYPGSTSTLPLPNKKVISPISETPRARADSYESQ